jgi:hypothetical protein
VRALAAYLIVGVGLWGSDSRGLRPRPTPADYPAYEAGADATVAAAVLTPGQVKAAFSTELKEYLVLEVGVFPAAGQPLDLLRGDFAIRAGARGELVRAANPAAIAASNQRKASPPPSSGRDVTLYPTASVGYESGTWTDPATGQRRHAGGVYTDTGVGVAVGDPGYPQPPRPGSTDRDREVMNQELADKMLPEGKTADPVGGYLYFRLPAKARTSALELQYFAAGGKVRVLLPAVKTK